MFRRDSGDAVLTLQFLHGALRHQQRAFLHVNEHTHAAVLCCDVRRVFELPPGSRMTVRRGAEPVRVVRLRPRPFTDRLVAKFGLPVQGFRRNGEAT